MAYTTIDNPKDYFSVNLWVADDASSRALTGFGHQPDLVWTKHRGSGATYHTLTDSVRGGDKQLSTPTNAAEDSGSHGKISAFGSDGITVIDGTNATYPRLTFNELDPFGASVGGNYVGWSWKAGGSTASNSSGDITSTVSVNTTSKFSIVSYEGNRTDDQTVGHSLGVVPEMIITKPRDIADNWGVYHKSIGNTHGLYLNTTAAKIDSVAYWSDADPTSTLVTLGENEATNDDESMIMYAFAPVQGFSKFGSYTGNGNADGTFVYTGFRVGWVMIKRTDGTNGWYIYDSARDPINQNTKALLPAEADAEQDESGMDLLSNGFKLRNTDGSKNGSGNSYIYAAFAESPFVNSNGIPTTAR